MSDPASETAEASRLIQMALRHGSDDAFVLGLCAFATFYLLGNVEDGAALMERARSLNPNLAILWGGAGMMNVCLGRSDIGIGQFEYAIRLSPLDTSMGLWQQGIALAHFVEARDADAVTWATMAVRESGANINALSTLAASLAFLERTDDARRVVTQLEAIEPTLRLSHLPDLRLLRRTQDRTRLIQGLRRAGLPE
jgi:hypothetical protein